MDGCNLHDESPLQQSILQKSDGLFADNGVIGPHAARAWPARSAGHMRGQGPRAPRACAGRARSQRGPVTVFKPKTSVASFRLVNNNDCKK